MFRSALNIIAAAHVLDRLACVESYDEITDQGTRLKKLLRTNFSEGTEHTFPIFVIVFVSMSRFVPRCVCCEDRVRVSLYRGMPTDTSPATTSSCIVFQRPSYCDVCCCVCVDLPCSSRGDSPEFRAGRSVWGEFTTLPEGTDTECVNFFLIIINNFVLFASCAPTT